ncbi:hypothetical protein SpCBS45565_g06245 [Spizellomyces sp. 'palustris']|nr:hypothetical protein SpCBS45565_g06245 [Spizellomyces sp. 'palustris']
MTSLVTSLGKPSVYKDNKYLGTDEDWEREIAASSTLYIGNLSFYTTEEQIYELFSKCGEIKRIIMGLDRFKKTPCGFCFVEYYNRQDTMDCMKFINGTKLDERVIRTDLDPGYKEGRNFGRGRSGGQVRDEHREDYDEGRGGWGARQREMEARENRQRDTYDSFTTVPKGAASSYYAGDSSYKPKRARDDEDEGPRRGKRGRDDDRNNPRFRERSATPEDD